MSSTRSALKPWCYKSILDSLWAVHRWRVFVGFIHLHRTATTTRNYKNIQQAADSSTPSPSMASFERRPYLSHDSLNIGKISLSIVRKYWELMAPEICYSSFLNWNISVSINLTIYILLMIFVFLCWFLCSCAPNKHIMQRNVRIHAVLYITTMLIQFKPCSEG